MPETVQGPQNAGKRAQTVRQTNAEISRAEVAAFVADVPDRYFAYHADRSTTAQMGRWADGIGATITTWTGDKLADVVERFPVYRSNLGDRRQNFRARGINGATYSGTAYLDAGDYVRMRRVSDAR